MRIAHILEGRFANRKSRFSMALAVVSAFALTGIGTTFATATLAETGSGRIVEGRVAVSFGIIRADGTFHRGVDIAAPSGTPIFAPEDMLVVEASDVFHGEPRYGKGVELQTVGGTRALFTHLDSYSVKAGDRVSKGDAFATVGLSGSTTKRPHLHLEAFRNDARVDPLILWPQLGK